jgi:alanine dehydrogenase
MIIGIPKEVKNHECRLAMVPCKAVADAFQLNFAKIQNVIQ